MTYQEISKEHTLVVSSIEKLKENIIQEITKLFDSCGGSAVCFNKLKHLVCGPISYFRLIKKNGEIHSSAGEHCDELSHSLRKLELNEVRFIYEIMYHKFYDVTK